MQTDEKDKIIQLNERINELEKEDKRLCNVITDLHDDIRRYDTKVKKQRMIIQIQSEIIKQYSELCKISNAELWIETENGCERIEL